VTAQQIRGPARTQLRWCRVFPATPDQVGAARRFLAGIVRDNPAGGDAVLCLSELAANSVLHSHSARPGGQFTVRVTRTGGRLRVAVTDDGGPWAPQPGGGCNGRGLAVVLSVADELRITSRDRPRPARTVTFEVPI
jgi:serine/threonine-protein kinase RsbW